MLLYTGILIDMVQQSCASDIQNMSINQYLNLPWSDCQSVSKQSSVVVVRRCHKQCNSPVLGQLSAGLITTALRLLLVLITAATVIKVANLVTVKQLLLQPGVDLVVYEAGPARGSVTAACLGRVFCQQLAEVGGAVSARVEAGKELDVRLEGEAVVGGGLLGEAGHHGVEELPRGAAELGSTGGECVSTTLRTKKTRGNGPGGGYASHARGREAYFAVAFSNLGAMDSPDRMLLEMWPRSGVSPLDDTESPLRGTAAAGGAGDEGSLVLLEKRYETLKKATTARRTMSVRCCLRAMVGDWLSLDSLRASLRKSRYAQR